MHSSERRSGMPHLADWFSAGLNSKEDNIPSVPPQQPQQFGPRPNIQQFQQGSNTNRCFNCGSADHFIKNCPRPRKPFQGQGFNQNNQGKGKKRVMQVRQWRVNFATLVELPE
jgi:hypothetical protein